MENIIEVLQELKNMIQWFQFWAYISKWNKIITLNIYLCSPIHWRITHTSQDMETSCVYPQINREDMVYKHNEILSIPKKE